MVVYVLDTSVFITAHRLHYPLDVFPVFWEKLVELAQDGMVCSIDKVLEELKRGEKDELLKWAKENFSEFFFSTDEAKCLAQYKRLIKWARRSENYQEAAVQEFADHKNADAWLVAYAKAYGKIVVSFETSEPHRKNRIKIPDACSANRVECITPMEMFRRLNVQFS